MLNVIRPIYGLRTINFSDMELPTKTPTNCKIFIHQTFLKFHSPMKTVPFSKRPRVRAELSPVQLELGS